MERKIIMVYNNCWDTLVEVLDKEEALKLYSEIHNLSIEDPDSYGINYFGYYDPISPRPVNSVTKFII